MKMTRKKPAPASVVSRHMERAQASDYSPVITLVGFPQVGKSALLEQLKPAGMLEELPGIYMLGCNTEQEAGAYDKLLGRGKYAPAGIVAVVDAAALDRQLYLAFQLIDLRLPLVLCLTGRAAATNAGITVDTRRLAEMTGVPVFVVPDEVDAAREAIVQWQTKTEDTPRKRPDHWRPSVALADAYQHLDTTWIHKHLHLYTGARLVEGLRLLTVPKAVEEYEAHPAYKSLLRALDESRKMLEDKQEKWTTAEVVQRSKWIGQLLQAVVTQSTPPPPARNWFQKLFD
ncbi:MAG: FeoB small GTPase domain-containing protein [Bacteroidota bacterium]